MKYHILSILVVLSFVQGISAEQCGRQAGGALCPGGLCCSEHGRCGSTNAYCGANCQSQCGTGTTPSPPSTPTPTPSGGGSGDVGSIISQALFDQLLKHRNDGVCEANGFYPYDAFITAAGSFNGFGTTGDLLTLVRRNLQRFWLKPLMKLEEGGQSQQMAHMHGDIAFSEKEIEEFIVMIRLRHSTNGPASPVDNTTAEDPSNSPTTTTMGQRVGPLNGSVKQPGYGSY